MAGSRWCREGVWFVVCIGLCRAPLTAGEWAIEEPWRLRPPLVLVLSGGGARGLAQLGVLEVLERAGLVPDAIVGTSIGALIGGLYACGYTPEELQALAATVDWEELLGLERYERSELFTDRRAEEDRSIVTLYFDNFRPVLPLAVSSGVRLATWLQELVWKAPYGAADFDRLRCRFRAVATDLVSGEAVVLRSGDLALAMRASAVFPLQYAPVHWDTLLLVDGGLRANLPVRLAQREFPGAIVVAVNTTAPLRTKAELHTPWALADQSISLLMQYFVQYDRAAADVLIEPALGEHGTLEFRDIHTLIARGREAAERAIPALRARLRHFWDSVAQLSLMPQFGAGLVPAVVELVAVGFRADDERTLAELHMLPLPQAVGGVLAVGACGAYRRLSFRWRWNGIGVVLECRAEPYPEVACVEFGGVPAPVAQWLESRLRAEKVVASPALRRHWEWRLLRCLQELGYRFVRPLWRDEDSCLSVTIRVGQVREVTCAGLSEEYCRELTELLQLRPEVPLVWEAFWQRWRRLQGSGLFRALELRLRQEADGLVLSFVAEQEPSERLHVGLRIDSERYTRLWLEAIHRRGLSRPLEWCLAAGIGPRDAFGMLQLTARRLFPEVWAALTLRVYGGEQLVRLFQERLTASGWELMSMGDLREQRYGLRLIMSFPFQPLDVLEGWVRYERQRDFQVEPSPFQKLFLWGGRYAHDSRDRAQFPHRGQSMELSLEGTVPWVTGITSFVRALLSYERAIALDSRRTLSIGFRFGAGDATTPPLEFFSLGGIENMLGMRTDQRQGRQLIAFSATYLFPSPLPLGMPTELFLRWDSGNVWETPRQIRLSELFYSLGGGIVVKTPIGLGVVAVGRAFRFDGQGAQLRLGPTVVAFQLGNALP